MPRIQFLQRCIIETIPTPEDVVQAREEEQRSREEETGPVAIPPAALGNVYHAPAWYGVERDAVIQVDRCYERGDWWLIDLTDRVQARIPLPFATQSVRAIPSNDAPHLLPDEPLTAKIAAPALFFRNPEERGFWKAIVRNPLDETNRLVYADWLDDHNDPDAWIFRERLVFNTRQIHGLKWDEAAAFLARPNSTWHNLTIQVACSQYIDHRYHRYVPYHFANGSHPPQFVAYLLTLIRLRMWIVNGQ